MNARPPHLGTGWAFPPQFDDATGGVQLVSAEKDIAQSLEILLSTSLGERVMQPEYGCNLKDYQFESVDNSLIGYLKDLITRAILFHEARIKLDSIDIGEPETGDFVEGILRITLEYSIQGTNSRYNYVYDFYLNEAEKRT